jgi:sugar phosphate isomerase/epimerase
MDIGILSDEIALDLTQALTLGRGLGIRKYEIRCIDDYNNRIPDIPSHRINELKNAVSGGDIIITGVTPGLFKVPFQDAAQLEKDLNDLLPRACDLCMDFNCPRVIAFSVIQSAHGSRERAMELIAKAATTTAAYGLQLSIENEPGFYCHTGVATAAFLQELNLPAVGVNWDPANAVIAGEAAYPVGYDAILPHIQNVHVKDSIPLPPDKWENRLIGDGGVNWWGQLRSLLRDRPVSHLTLETHVFPVLENTREDLRRLQILMRAVEELNEQKIL